MVVHDDSERPTEVFFENKKLIAQKYYTSQENRTKDLESNDLTMITPPENSEVSIQDSIEKCKLKSNKKRSRCSSTYSDENLQCSGEISTEDLKELKTVYRKCKAVIKKIEIKYGHILGLDLEEPNSKHKKTTDGDKSECQCTLNKKIVFDENGKELMIDRLPSNHICPQNLMCQKTQIVTSEHKVVPESRGVQIEYAINDIQLPDDLQELAAILQNPDLEATYRNQVLDKVRLIKQDNTNEIRFNKPFLVEKLKTDPDTILDFKGANMSVLSGYP